MKLFRFVLIFFILAIVFVGVYLCLYGGIVQFIDGVKISPVNSGDIAWGVIRVVLTIPCVWAVVMLSGLLAISFKGVR